MLTYLIYLKIMKILHRLGNILISDTFVLPVVSFWYSTWKLQDRYLFPDNPGLSNGLSLSFGILGLCILGLKQFSLTTELQGKHCVVFFCVSRIIVLFWAIFGICHWRGLWNILDNYTGRYSSEILLAACLFFLVLFRSVRNVITTPFVVGFDGDRNQFFNQSMIFGKIIGSQMSFGLDVLLSVPILGSLIVVFWRDVWKIYDDHLFPEDKTQTIIFSVVVFVTIQILAEPFQILFRNTIECMGRRHYIIKLLVQDVYFILVGVGNVACWRSVWKTIDIILDMVDYDIGLGVMFPTSFVSLTVVCSCTSLVMKGFAIDGEVEKWYEFSNDFITNSRSCILGTDEKEKSKDVPVEFIIHL